MRFGLCAPFWFLVLFLHVQKKMCALETSISERQMSCFKPVYHNGVCGDACMSTEVSC